VYFDSAFAPVADVALAADPQHPVQFVNAGRVLADNVILSDAKAGDVKVYSLRSGSFRRVVGAPGDGPGEFRYPVAISTAGPDQFAVLDQKRRTVSFHDTTGRLVRAAALREGSFNGLLILPAQARIIVSGNVALGDTPAKGMDIHEYDYSGRRLGSYSATAVVSSEWAKRFDAKFVALTPTLLVEGSLNSNVLRLIDRVTRSERRVQVGDGWYRPLVWPSDKALRPGYSQQTAVEIGNAWMRQQRMMNGIAALGGDRLLVRFQAFSPTGDRFYYYALADTAGRTFWTSRPTRDLVLDAHADTIYSFSKRGGAYHLRVGLLRGALASGSIASR
jgi:hypothetical protein